MEQNKKLVVANWKMNPGTIVDAEKLFFGIKDKASKMRNVQTVICPPFVYLSELFQFYTGQRIAFGAQDVFWETNGAYTGEISANQLVSIGARYVIIGHSERRALGETDEMVNKKVHVALKAGLLIIFCFGERERDESAAYIQFLHDQLINGLYGVSKNQLQKVVVAYEPIWAIGKAAHEAMQPDDVHEMVIFIRKVLAHMHDAKTAQQVPVLYGGSVEPNNASAIFTRSEVSGFLIGHASLKAAAFNDILETVNKFS